MSDDMDKRAMDELLITLKSRTQFVKVHAGEFLIWLGHPEEVRTEFLRENELHSNEPKYRIVVWRVLAQTEREEKNRTVWTGKIMDAFKDTSGPDRIHAAETLGKLKLSPLEKFADATMNALRSDNRNLNVYTLWATSYSSDSSLRKNRREFLRLLISDSNEIVRKISAYILRNIRGLSPEDWRMLANSAFSEPPESELKTTLFNTAFVTKPEDVTDVDLIRKIQDEMKKDHHLFTAGKRIELALSLAQSGTSDDRPLLVSILNDEKTAGIYEKNSDEGADVRAAAAYALLKIKERAK